MIKKKKLKLTTWERISLYRILGEARGTVEVMEKCLKLRALLKLDEDEQAAINSKYEATGLQFLGSPQEFEAVLKREWNMEFPNATSFAFMLNSGIGYNAWLGSDAPTSVPLVRKLKKALKELP